MTAPTTELLGDLRERMVRIETKLDTHADNYSSVRTDLDDHTQRLLKLETNHRVFATIGAAALFVVTFFQNAITSLVGL